MNIRYGTAGVSDYNSLKELWLSCFEDIPKGFELFFYRNINNLSIYCARTDGDIAAAVYLLGGTVNGMKAHYLCGASTREAYRGRGIMTALINFALGSAAKNGDRLSLLYPANEGLYRFYSRFGYRAECTLSVKSLGRNELSELSGGSTDFHGDYEELQRLCFKNNFLLQNNDFIGFAAEYYALYGATVLSDPGSLAVLSEKNAEAEVYYYIYDNIGSLTRLLLENTNAARFRFSGKPGTKPVEGGIERVCGMVKPLGGVEIPKGLYIGMTLD